MMKLLKFDERIVEFLNLQVGNLKYVLIVQCHVWKKLIFYLVISCVTTILTTILTKH
jgi:hypothetical protein